MTEGTTVLDKLNVHDGDKRTHIKTITAEDIDLFARVSGDFNPIHVDEEFAKKTFFGGRIAHGAFAQALLSAAMAKYPGLVIFMSQQLKFLRPVRVGDTITAEAEVTNANREKGILTLKNTCTNQKGEVVVSGEAAVRLYEKPE